MRCESSNEKYGSQDDIHVIFCLYPIHRPAKLENRITKEKKKLTLNMSTFSATS